MIRRKIGIGSETQSQADRKRNYQHQAREQHQQTVEKIRVEPPQTPETHDQQGERNKHGSRAKKLNQPDTHGPAERAGNVQRKQRENYEGPGQQGYHSLEFLSVAGG